MNRRLLGAIIIVLLASVIVANSQAYAQSAAAFPTIYYETYEGFNVTITNTSWYSVVYPVIYSSNFSSYNWKDSPLKDYLIFGYGLAGLNPYGAEFIQALSDTGNLTEKNVTTAFERISALDATGTGYSNQQKLDAGALPGFSNSTPTSFTNPHVRSTYGWVFAGAVVVSIIALYFIFNRKKNE